MADREFAKELYQSTFKKVHAPAELLRKVENMENNQKNSKKVIILRRTAVVAAAVVTLFVLSNMVALASAGETWVGRIFWHDENPNQPMENVQEFFIKNGDKFDGDPGNARRDYYGGTYLDGGEQVILLTDLSHADAFTEVGKFIRFEKCDYTYAELIGAIDRMNDLIPTLSRKSEGYAEDMIGWGLNDKENCVFVDIYEMTDEKVKWFRENILDEEFLVFENADTFPGLD